MARVEGGVRDGSAEVRPQLHAVIEELVDLAMARYS
jgi:hypothetical protein